MTTTIASFPAAEYIYLPTKYRIPLLFFEYLPETALTCSFLSSAPARTATADDIRSDILRCRFLFYLLCKLFHGFRLERKPDPLLQYIQITLLFNLIRKYFRNRSKILQKS